MTNEHPLGEEFAAREPLDRRELIKSIEEWAGKPHKGCSRTKCMFHANSDCDVRGYCNYMPFMIDHPERRPQDGNCMRGCLPGKDCIRYMEGKKPRQRQPAMTITLPRTKTEKEAIAASCAAKPKFKSGRPSFDRDRVKALYEAGLTDKEIGQAIGRAAITVAKWRQANKLPSNYYRKKLNVRPLEIDFDKDRALQLYKEKKTDSQIAKIVNTSRRAVTKWREDIGLKSVRERIEEETAQKRREMRELYDKGCTDEEIAEKVGKTAKTVCHWRWNNKLPINRKDLTERERLWQRFRELYDMGLNDPQIAKETGSCQNTVHRWRDREGLKPHKRSFNEAVMMEMYKKGMTDKEMAEKAGKSSQTVRNWRIENGLKKNINLTGGKRGSNKREMPDEEEIAEILRRRRERQSVEQISTELNRSYKTIKQILKENGMSGKLRGHGEFK